MKRSKLVKEKKLKDTQPGNLIIVKVHSRKFSADGRERVTVEHEEADNLPSFVLKEVSSNAD